MRPTRMKTMASLNSTSTGYYEKIYYHLVATGPASIKDLYWATVTVDTVAQYDLWWQALDTLVKENKIKCKNSLYQIVLDKPTAE